MGIQQALTEAAKRQQDMRTALRNAAAEDAEKEAERANDKTTAGGSPAGRNERPNA